MRGLARPGAAQGNALAAVGVAAMDQDKIGITLRCLVQPAADQLDIAEIQARTIGPFGETCATSNCRSTRTAPPGPSRGSVMVEMRAAWLTLEPMQGSRAPQI